MKIKETVILDTDGNLLKEMSYKSVPFGKVVSFLSTDENREGFFLKIPSTHPDFDYAILSLSDGSYETIFFNIERDGGSDKEDEVLVRIHDSILYIDQSNQLTDKPLSL